ncbi:uncharacterized protein I206_104410 [Kwoniella pini CBS 10737]|uniref:Cyclase n=1 Tax=Kwoniella pini CBS 10737 TaxID=1296096 RepID=A0A1B9I1Q8_9TREE|nr:uncharacterized protein I206_04007 [Kwoniella pini CBS 10737]OCF49486.1 hypothetical protein I206_04007 [Kwoniella pini CBS 10737]
MTSESIPPFSSLPIDKSGPPYNAWGLYGSENEKGRLNLITAENIKRGKDTITEGITINLNLPLDFLPVHASRLPLEHNIKCSGHSNDDILNFNTQGSTQWDGFRHYPYQNWPEEGKFTFYGGMDISEASNKEIKKYGVQNYSDKPITSIAHLIDIPLYLSKNNLPSIDSFSNSNPISLKIIKSCIKEFKINIKSGDILLIKTGFIESILSKSNLERNELKNRKKQGNQSCGIESSEEIWKWHWEKGISAVASDCPSYEAWPAPSNILSCHEIFLAGWGLPIGELFDLRELSKQCKKFNKWTFFFTSMGLNVPGGIATPPNAQAIL